jgi:hypothetical protein
MKMIRKTHDKELDALVEKLLASWDSGPSGDYKYVVDADIAAEAADKLISMFELLESFEAQHYNRQMNF